MPSVADIESIDGGDPEDGDGTHRPAASAEPTLHDRLSEVERLLALPDLTALELDELPPLTAVLRRIEARCAALGVAIARRARAGGDDPRATLLGDGRVSRGRARREDERAAITERIPALGDALADGRASAEHLDRVATVEKGLTADEARRFHELGDRIASAAERQPVDDFARHLHRLVDESREDHGLTRLQRQRSRSNLKLWVDRDGMGHLHALADPERFAVIRAAIEQETDALAAACRGAAQSAAGSGAPVSSLTPDTGRASAESDASGTQRVVAPRGPKRQLEALVELLGRAQGAAGRPTVSILVDDRTVTLGPHEATVCETADGTPLPITVVRRLLCDATARTVRTDRAGLVLDVGRASRTATPAQWAALRAMYATCAWHGCDRPITWCQAHHIVEWGDDGPTDLDNLVPLCSRHHQAVHDDGWRLRLLDDRTLEIHRPPATSATRDGPAWTTRPDRRPRGDTSSTDRIRACVETRERAPTSEADPPNGRPPFAREGRRGRQLPLLE